MTAEISPALQALRLEQATAFMEDARSRLIDSDPLAFHRWAADRQYDDARTFAHAARMERRVCGRCGQGSVAVVQCGPYTACEPCAAIINT